MSTMLISESNDSVIFHSSLTSPSCEEKVRLLIFNPSDIFSEISAND